VKGGGKKYIKRFFEIQDFIDEDINEFGLTLKEISIIH